MNKLHRTEELAGCIALIAYNIRDLTIDALTEGANSRMLRDLYERFQKVLLPDLTVSSICRYVRSDACVWFFYGTPYAQWRTILQSAVRYEHYFVH